MITRKGNTTSQSLPTVCQTLDGTHDFPITTHDLHTLHSNLGIVYYFIWIELSETNPVFCFFFINFPLESIYRPCLSLLFFGQVENSGDPWLKGRNSQNISYFESIYLVMATMSTVGFGDVVPRTSLGRIFIIVFTLGSLVKNISYIF